jgi:hypothetical protein
MLTPEDLSNIYEFLAQARKLKYELPILEVMDVSDKAWDETMLRLQRTVDLQ